MLCSYLVWFKKETYFYFFI